MNSQNGDRNPNPVPGDPLPKARFFQGFDTQAQEIYYFKMVDRTFKLIVEQLVVFMAALPQQESSFSAWCHKLRKSYKALRLMEVHKQVEPQFARSMRLLYPHLTKAVGVNSEDEVDENVYTDKIE